MYCLIRIKINTWKDETSNTTTFKVSGKEDVETVKR